MINDINIEDKKKVGKEKKKKSKKKKNQKFILAAYPAEFTMTIYIHMLLRHMWFLALMITLGKRHLYFLYPISL